METIQAIVMKQLKPGLINVSSCLFFRIQLNYEPIFYEDIRK